MRSLAMRFRGILRGADVQKLDQWLDGSGANGKSQAYSPKLAF
jgi:hypothetical protein